MFVTYVPRTRPPDGVAIRGWVSGNHSSIGRVETGSLVQWYREGCVCDVRGSECSESVTSIGVTDLGRYTGRWSDPGGLGYSPQGPDGRSSTDIRPLFKRRGDLSYLVETGPVESFEETVGYPVLVLQMLLQTLGRSPPPRGRFKQGKPQR